MNPEQKQVEALVNRTRLSAEQINKAEEDAVLHAPPDLSKVEIRLRKKRFIAEAQLQEVLSDPALALIDKDQKAPKFKITTIGEERSMPQKTQVRFLLEDEYQDMSNFNRVIPKEEE